MPTCASFRNLAESIEATDPVTYVARLAGASGSTMAAN
jgi:hypothetical protein